MAMYENKGTCPEVEFAAYSKHHEVSDFWDRTLEILEDRIGYMVYLKSCNNYKGSYIVDALEGAEYTLGIEVACALKHLIPVCNYAECGKPIICTDLVNPYQIPAKIYECDGKWDLCLSEDKEKTLLFEDDRYLIAIQHDDEVVNIYLYKK